MSSKIFRSSFFATLLILTVTIAFIMSLLTNLFDRQIRSEIVSEAQYLKQAVENESVSFLESLDNKDRRITLVNPDGTVVFDNQADASSLDNHAEREEIKQAMAEGTGMSKRYSDTLTEKTIYYAVKLDDNRILRVSTNQYTLVSVLLGLMQPFIIVFVIAFVLTAVLSSRVSKSIVKPINNLNLENPENNETYEELTPLLRKISDQKRTISNQIAELSKRDETRREFTANVSHELKTPLTSISGFAELMKNGDVPRDVAADFSKSIYDETQRLISLVNDIIELSELDEKNIPLEKEDVDLYELSGEILDRLKSEAAKKNVSLNLIGGSAKVLGVRKILDEMIYNLCDNAIKYNKENVTVDVIVNDADKKAYLTVRDTGIGINAEHRLRVFERFYRVDKSRSKQVGGTGLGLAIVKHGAIYHNAEITLESAEGKGTSVTLAFDKG